MIIRFFLILFAAVQFASTLRAETRPNIILVMADDQGWGDMAYNGHPNIHTPNFDEAAASGLRFDRFYAAAPVCSPTRASVMTGRHPNRMGVFKWGYPMRPQETTLAEALKTAGYATGHFGKWHLGSVRNDSPANPGRNGFDRWVSAPNFYENDAILSDQGKAVKKKGESSFIPVDDALHWMTPLVRKNTPVFAVIWFGSPHGPHISYEEYAEPYADLDKKDREFRGEITGMDAAFGKLRRSLTDLGIRDNTVLWYCSDNGALKKVGSAGKFRGNKGQIYEGGLLVPSILEWPAKITQPRPVKGRCNTCDIYPTILEIAGVKVDRQAPLDGVSLLPVIEGGETPSRSMGFWDVTVKGISTPSASWMKELYEAQQAGNDLPAHPSSQNAAKLPEPEYTLERLAGHAAWVEDDWKLHRIVTKKSAEPVWELYHLARDPEETDNVLASQSEIADQLRPKLETWIGSVLNSLNGRDY